VKILIALYTAYLLLWPGKFCIYKPYIDNVMTLKARESHNYATLYTILICAPAMLFEAGTVIYKYRSEAILA